MERKCKTCGGQLAEVGYGKYKCAWCNNEYTDDELAKRGRDDVDSYTQLSKARNALEIDYDFSKSLNYSQSVLEKDPKNQQALWLALIAECQIIYIQNDEGEYVPTFLDPASCPIKQSKYYAKLDENNKKNADQIEKVRLEAVSEYKRVKPYDVFISYKQHTTQDEDTETIEATWARDIYTELKTNPETRDLRVFFDQKCLTGANAGWEPHIYSAIRSSRCMIILGSSIENINSRWVKNEWKRFLALRKQGEEKEFIVLGSDDVNPKLLDQGLRKKQMIKNTSGRWMDEIVDQVVSICNPDEDDDDDEYDEDDIEVEDDDVAAAINEQQLADLKRRRIELEERLKEDDKVSSKYSSSSYSHSSGGGGKIFKTIAIIVGIVLVIGAIGGFTWWRQQQNSKKQINYVIEQVELLPDESVEDYSYYEDKIYEVYGKYNELSDSQKKKVTNADKLLAVVQRFNQYVVGKVRTLMEAITPANVETSDQLKQLKELNEKLLDEQRALLNEEEKRKIDNYGKAYDIIEEINDIKDHIDEKYDATRVGDLKAKYGALPSEVKGLVYNYDLVDGFASYYDFVHNKLSFTKLKNGGWSVKMNRNAQVAGELIIPASYKNEPVYQISSGGFENQRSVTKVVIPDCVTFIGSESFMGCEALEEITLPFVGTSLAPNTESYAVFGIIFGYSQSKDASIDPAWGVNDFVNVEKSPINGLTPSYAWDQWGVGRTVNCYKIPQTLKYVTVTRQDVVPLAAFNHCSMLKKITFKKKIANKAQLASLYAFNDCVQPTEEVDSSSFLPRTTAKVSEPQYAILPQKKFCFA